MEIAPSVFNPALGQHVRVSLDWEVAGSVQVEVLDRDGYRVRLLTADQAITPGLRVFVWDGRDDNGELVPDEAYSFRVRFESPSGESIDYFPANGPTEHVNITVESYDRTTGVLRYRMPFPGRVHMQGGTAGFRDDDGSPLGPVLRTIINRAPRPAGSIIEHWDGADESDVIHVPSLDHFVISAIATPLPENSVIAQGNNLITYEDRVKLRAGSSQVSPSQSHGHHAGLSWTDDISPSLALTVEGARWNPGERRWFAADADTIGINVQILGPAGEAFRRHPGVLHVFVDGARVNECELSACSSPLRVVLKDSGDSVITVNWASRYGPLAVGSARVARGALVPEAER